MHPADAGPDAMPSLTIRRRVIATPATVFRAWTEPAHLAQWFGPDDGPVLEAEIDARAGGTFRVRFRTHDDVEHTARGTYREVVRDVRLVFTWCWAGQDDDASLVTVELAPDGDGTLMTFRHEQFASEAARDEHATGWHAAFNKLERLLA